MSDHHSPSAPATYNAGEGMGYYNEVNDSYMSNGYDMREHQSPIGSVAHCSDSRQKAEMATGIASLGNTLELANPGGFLTGPDGKLTSDAGRWLDLTTAYGIDKAAVVQHSGCGQMNVLYTYHKVAGGKEKIAKEKGLYFAADAELRRPLIDAVEKNGLPSYVKMGIPLVGDEAQQFQQAMAIQQLLWDVQAVEDARKEHSNLPKIEGQYQHIVIGRVFRLDSLANKTFSEIPVPVRTVNPACCCGKDCGCDH